MKLEEFEKIKDEYIKNRKRVKGYLKREDIKKADFNGVYLVLNENFIQVAHIQIDLL